MSADSMFGDEELEEGFGIEGVPEGRRRRDPEAQEDRRLSRDLEVGFRDDSDDEGLNTSAAKLQRDGA